jgi:hypothetical protein
LRPSLSSAGVNPEMEGLRQSQRALEHQMGEVKELLVRLTTGGSLLSRTPAANTSSMDSPVMLLTPPYLPTSGIPAVPLSARPASKVSRPLFTEPRVPPAVPTHTTGAVEQGRPMQSQAGTAPVQAYTGPPRPTQRKVPEPNKFKGTMAERDKARMFLHAASTWLRLTCEGETDDVRVAMFSTLLQDSALTWFTNLETRAQRELRALTLQEVFSSFIETYEGGVSRRLAEQQLQALVYRKGKCTDLSALDGEFNRLVDLLYPTAGDSEDADLMLAVRYAEILRAGDALLWEKAVEAGPVNLREWRAAAQNAYTILAIKRAATRAEPKSSSSFSTSRHGVPGHTVRVNQAAAAGNEDDADGSLERDEAQPEVALDAAAAKGRQGQGADKPKRPRMLTDTQYQQVRAENRCFQCYQTGHRARDDECPEKGKPRRKPAPGELKA